MAAELEILYRDSDCVAVNKPPGVLVHRSRVDTREDQNVLTMLRDQIGQWVYAAHRLDRGTSGVLLFGLSSEVARFFAVEFEERRVRKEYLAVVRGWPADRAVIDRPLTPWYDRISDPKGGDAKPAQEAITEYETLDRCECEWSVGRYPQSRYSLIRLHPLTGRRHQIRRHLNRAAYPIIGDVGHGDHRHNHYFRDVLGIERMLLAASRLQVRHPASDELLQINASPGDDFAAACDRLGLNLPSAEIDSQ
ncbi:MAG: pseudouridine synthase [Planctomycetota bacterium]|jgi:tRNA pseudouridine65 synthase